MDCAGDALNYFKAIASSDFGEKVIRVAMGSKKHHEFQSIFQTYRKELGFECHFKEMAELLLNSKINPHTVVILQCPKAHKYGMAQGTPTGEAMFSFFKPIQKACEKLALSATTVLCIEACSYCPALVGKGKIRSNFDLQIALTI